VVLPAQEEEKGMKLDRVSAASKFKIQPILWRKIHKWVGLVLGLQFVMWTLSGTVMALLDSDKVGGHSAAPMAATAYAWPADLVTPATLKAVEGLTLRRIVDRPVYEINDGQGVRLLDARSGQPMSIDASLAENNARDAFHHKATVTSVARLDKANLEARDHSGAMWRVNFADDENSSSYVSADTGRALVNRGDTWRLWDIAWMLHNMDYVNRTSFNHPLIIFVAFGALWLSFTGFYLLFKSFRRREFKWILGTKKG
jgi:hypothetical protein